MEGISALVIILFLYFIPALVASQREHRQAGAILVINLFFKFGRPRGMRIINLFLGWPLLGWVIALAWACSDARGPV